MIDNNYNKSLVYKVFPHQTNDLLSKLNCFIISLCLFISPNDA